MVLLPWGTLDWALLQCGAKPAWESSGTWYFIVRNIFVKVFFILWPYFLLDCESVFFVIKHFKKGKSVNYHAFVNKFR